MNKQINTRSTFFRDTSVYVTTTTSTLFVVIHPIYSESHEYIIYVPLPPWRTTRNQTREDGDILSLEDSLEVVVLLT